MFGLADGFLWRGFATLCFDTRGVGQLTGQYIPAIPQNSFAIFDDLASDMAAGLEFLRGRTIRIVLLMLRSRRRP